jgi:hypothetical protein
LFERVAKIQSDEPTQGVRVMNKYRLDTAHAAEILDQKPTTLVTWRSTKRYDLPYVKIGGKVRYSEEDLLAFIESRKVRASEPCR